MQNKTILKRLIRNNKDNHFFISESKDFIDYYWDCSENSQEDWFQKPPIPTVKNVTLSSKHKTAKDILEAITREIWTPIEVNAKKHANTVVEISNVLREINVRTDYIYFTNPEVLFNIRSRSESTKVFHALKGMCALSGVRYLIIGNVETYQKLQKLKIYFLPFVVHNLDSTNYKQYFKGDITAESEGPVLLGGAEAIVLPKRKYDVERLVSVVPCENLFGNYTSIDERRGVVFWDVSELEFLKKYTKKYAVSILEKLRDEGDEFNENIYIISSDNRRFLFHKGFYGAGLYYTEKESTGYAIDGNSKKVEDINKFIENELPSIFSISFLKEETKERHQNFSKEVTPLIEIVPPIKDTFYTFTTVYHSFGTNVFYFEQESMLEHDLKLENANLDDVADRIIDDLSDFNVTIDESNNIIKESSSNRFVISKTIEHLRLAKDTERIDEYLSKIKNIENEFGPYAQTKSLATEDIIAINEFNMEFYGLSSSDSEEYLNRVDGLHFVPVSMFISKKTVDTKSIKKTRSVTTITPIKN